MSEPTKRKPLLYEGDTILLSGFFESHLTEALRAGQFELIGILNTPKGKILEVRKAEDGNENS